RADHAALHAAHGRAGIVPGQIAEGLGCADAVRRPEDVAGLGNGAGHKGNVHAGEVVLHAQLLDDAVTGQAEAFRRFRRESQRERSVGPIDASGWRLRVHELTKRAAAAAPASSLSAAAFKRYNR